MRSILFIVVSFLVFSGCQKNTAPEEVVRIQEGKSVMATLAPIMKRYEQGSKVIIVQDNVSSDDIEKNMKYRSQTNKSSGYQPLYVSGQKAKAKKEQNEKIKKAFEKKNAGK